MGPRSIFVIGRAEQMVSQAASQEAANAFLKLLEEPPPDVYLLLTSSRPGALLPTVLSRVLSVRVLPLQDREVTEFLETHGGASADDAARAARLAQGSIGRALDVLGGEEARYSDAERLLAAAVSGKRSDRFSYSLSLSSRGARGGFLSVLDAAGELLRDQLALATGNENRVLDHERAVRLSRKPLDAGGLLAALESLEEAKQAASGNVNPQAVSAALLSDLAAALAPDGARAPGRT